MKKLNKKTFVVGIVALAIVFANINIFRKSYICNSINKSIGFESLDALADGANSGELPAGWISSKEMGEVKFQDGVIKGWSFLLSLSLKAVPPTVTVGGGWDGSRTTYEIIRCCIPSDKANACNPVGNYPECAYCTL